MLFFNVWGRGKVGEMGLRRFVCLGIVLVCWCRVVVRLSFVCVRFCLLVCCAVPRWGHVENCLDCFSAARRLIVDFCGWIWFYEVSSSICVSSITHLLFLSQGFELVMFKKADDTFQIIVMIVLSVFLLDHVAADHILRNCAGWVKILQIVDDSCHSGFVKEDSDAWVRLLVGFLDAGGI